MMRVTGSIALALSLLLAACGGKSTPSNPSTPTLTLALSPRVVVVSIDGLRASAVQQVHPSNMTALAAMGAYTWNAQTTAPSNTLPSHTSMLTGYPMARHGITWDDYAPANGAIKVPTIFFAAHKAGLRTAMMAGKEKFNTFRDAGDIDVFVGGTRGDADVADRAIAQLYGGVDLLFIHLPDVDLSGHASSWMSTAYQARVMAADEALGRIMSALPEDTTLILTADHGGHASGHGTLDSLDMSIPWIIAGPRIRQAHALTSAVSTMDTAATVGFILGLTLPADITGKPVLEAFASK